MTAGGTQTPTTGAAPGSPGAAGMAPASSETGLGYAGPGARPQVSPSRSLLTGKGGGLGASDAPAEPPTTPADLLALLDGLDAARAKATPGEWRAGGLPGARSEGTVDVVGDRTSDAYIAVCWRSPADAALIVAAVNNQPKLTAALRAVLVLLQDAERFEPDDVLSRVSAANLRYAIEQATS